MINKNKHTILGMVGSWSVFLLLIVGFFYFFQNSYAIEVQEQNFPTETFSSNYTSGDKVNLLAKALQGNLSYANKIFNFEVPDNYKLSDNSKPLYTLMKNLKVPAGTEKFEITDDNPIEIKDAGLLYILSHGYNTVNTTNTIFSTNKFGGVTDNAVKQYITQIATWLYLFENKTKFNTNYCIDTGRGINSCDFYVNGSTTLVSSTEVRKMISDAASKTGYNYLNYITLLVDTAKNYTYNNKIGMSLIDEDSIKYVIHDDGSYLTTEEITPAPSYGEENYLSYSLRLEDPNKYGAYLTDKDGNKITNTSNLSGSFKIHVPLKKDISSMDLRTIKVTLTGEFIQLKGFSYRVTTSSFPLIDSNKKQVFSDVVLGYSPTVNTSIEISLRNITRISKIDVSNSQELPGATLEIKDKATNKVIDTWVSTTSPKYFFLKNGNYILCETSAPAGYALNTECIDFTVDGTKIVAVEMKNDKAVEVPNTGKKLDKLVYICGLASLILGLAITLIVLFERKKKEQ